MIIARYLTREVVFTLLAVTTILLLAFLCQQTVRYLNFVAIGKIPTTVLLELISFEAPYILSFLLPLGLYLGILLAFGRLYADSEMAILQLAGFDQSRLLAVIAKIALFIVAVVLVLMFWVNPLVSQKRQQLMDSGEATMHLVQTLIPGRFQASSDGKHVMYVEKLSHDRERAENIFLAEEKKLKSENGAEQNVWMLVVANQGYQVTNRSKEQFFVTENGYRYEGTPGQNDYKIIQFRKYAVHIPQTESHNAHEENETLSMSQLWQEYSNPERAGEFQWRISVALTALLLALLAVPMSAIRPRQGRYLSLLPAVLVYVIYIQLLYLARYWLVRGMIPIQLGMWWVHALMGLFIVCVLFASTQIKSGKS